jgi:RNA polymerase sigma-70 factor (ECF subfamily)
MPIASSGLLTGGGLDRLNQLPIAELSASALGDEELLARYQAGQRAALDELFRRYRLLAYRVAYRLLGNEADALDAVQEGFVKVLVHLSTFQKRSSFKTWLLRVISNAALDLGRARGRQELRSLDVPDAEDREGLQPLAEENPTHGLERADLRHLLDEALATLPEPQRRTFVLHADAELSYREVAEVMGISIGTVMSRLYYARQKLRAFLARHPIADCGLRIAD